jgi:cytochrome c peroxidase
VVSLDSLVSFYLPAAKDTALERRIQGQLKAAGSYLSAHRDFNNFDRLYFIKEHADPISVSLSELAKRLDLVLPEERQMLSPTAPHLFATSFYSPSGYSPNAEANATNAKTLLGKKLFFDPVLSAGRQRSCASCHSARKGPLRMALQKALHWIPVGFSCAMRPRFGMSRFSPNCFTTAGPILWRTRWLR